MVGLSTELRLTQAIAVSTAFRAELMSKSPFNLGSTIPLISPLSIRDRTQLIRRSVIPSVLFISAGWPETSSSRTIPKLKTSLFLVTLPLSQYLCEKRKKKHKKKKELLKSKLEFKKFSKLEFDLIFKG